MELQPVRLMAIQLSVMSNFPYYFAALLWLPSFIYSAVGIALCLIYRRRNPKMAYCGIIMLLLAALFRIFEIAWLNRWLYEAEKSGLWSPERVDNFTLLLDIFVLPIRTFGGICAGWLVFQAKSQPKPSQDSHLRIT